jgi:hypothetical protein
MSQERTLSRRAWLARFLAGVSVPRAILAAAAGERRAGIDGALLGLRRTVVHSRRYSAHATIALLGLPVWSRRGVGGAFAVVELGVGPDTRGVALQFAAGSCPDHAAGLNRFGILRETVVERDSCCRESEFAGLITASREKSLEEGRRALATSGRNPEVTVTFGRCRNDNGWTVVENVALSSFADWTTAGALLDEILRRGPGAHRESESQGGALFLATMRRAALCGKPFLHQPFLHAGKQYLLETRRRTGASGELDGLIRSASGRKCAEFRVAYAAGDNSGLPIRIEYWPRPFLRLIFEAGSETQAPPIHSLYLPEDV